jgi:hypothetical protein
MPYDIAYPTKLKGGTGEIAGRERTDSCNTCADGAWLSTLTTAQTW